MDLRHMETFVKIAETGSFTRAGEKLYLTQPTVSKQVVDLERFFGVRLLDRTRREVVLTRAGEILLRYAKDLLSLKEELVGSMDAFKGLKTGSITVGASSIPGIYILPVVLKRFKERYGGIRVKLAISDTKATLMDVEEGTIDIGIVGAKNDAENLVYRKVLDDIIVVIAPALYPDTITVNDLVGYPFVIREEGSGTRAIFLRALKQATGKGLKDLNIAAELSDTTAIKEAIREGMGISCVSRLAVARELKGSAVKIVKVEGLPLVRRSFYLVKKKTKTVLPHVKAFIEILEEWRQHEKI